LRSDRSAARVARNGGPPLGSERLTTAAMHPSANPQDLTPTVMANNAAAENKKPD
jgi:hypothetical protein